MMLMDETTVSSCNNKDISSDDKKFMNDAKDITNDNITIMFLYENMTHVGY